MASLLSGIFLVPTEVFEAELPMFAPLPRSWQELERRRQVDFLLRGCWGSNDGYEVQLYDEWLLNVNVDGTNGDVDESNNPSRITERASRGMPQTQFRPSTYGEVTPKGVRQLIGIMGLMSYQAGHGDTDPSFFDLGSGAGKLVAQVALETDVCNSVGIELSPSRHEAAAMALDKLERQISGREQKESVVHDVSSQSSSELDLQMKSIEFGRSNGSRIQAIQADIFEADLSEATHIYVSSLCFTPDMMQKLQSLLFSPACPQLQCIASLRKFPTCEIDPYVRYIEMSWTKPRGAAVYIYNI